MSDSDSDIPELEAPHETTYKIYVDKTKLPLGDPAREFDDSQLEVAMQKRQKALQTYKDNLNEALLLISDAIEMFPNSATYLNTRAEIFRFNGDVQLALRDLKLVYQRSKENTPFKTYKMLAELLFDNQEFDQCATACKNALALDNDKQLQELMVEAQQRHKEQQERYKYFEQQQSENMKKQQEYTYKKEKTIHSDIYDEIKNKYGDNPVFYSDLFKNLFGTAKNMDDQKASQLMSNPMLMAAFEDPDFATKVAELARNPQAGAKLMGDEKFMKNFQNVLGAFK